ncbi:hypothetical protein PWT90_05374 [Aphanocladium album]|nr:hypothetical protein PWT90_05374 [Aphanocladium album]
MRGGAKIVFHRLIVRVYLSNVSSLEMRGLLQVAAASMAIRGAYADIINLHHGAIEGVVIHVRDDIVALHSAVKSFGGEETPVVAAAERLIDTIKSGTVIVDGAGQLTARDSFTLQDPIMSRRPEVAKANLCTRVYTLVADINIASRALIDSVISKFPEIARPIAKTLSTGLTDELQQTQDDFSTAHCKNSNGADTPTTTPASESRLPSTASPIPTNSPILTAISTSAASPASTTDPTSTAHSTVATSTKSASGPTSGAGSSVRSLRPTSRSSTAMATSAHSTTAINATGTSKPTSGSAASPSASAGARILTPATACLVVIVAAVLL